MTNRRLSKSLKRFSNKKEERVIPISGTLGIPLGGQKLVEVPNRKGFVYVRLKDNTSEIIQAYNSEVSTIYGLAVLVARQNNIYKVIGRDQDKYKDWGNIPYLPKHGGQHSFNQAFGMGADVTWIYSQQMMPLLVYPSGTSSGLGNNVIIAPHIVRGNDGSWKYVGNTGTASFSPYIPTTPSGAVMALVYIDEPSGNPLLLINSGTVFSNSITGSSQISQYIPALPNPATQIPLAAIRLVTGTTQVAWQNIYDVRQWLHTVPTGTAGGISTGTLDARYLKLDASNDPLTGKLDIKPSTIDTQGLNIETMGDASTFSTVQRATGSVGVGSAVFTLDREPSGDSSPTFSSPIMQLTQTHGASGTITGGILSVISDATERINININSQGTGTIAFIDGDFTLSPDGKLLLLKNHGTPKFYVNASGTAYSNNEPLIKEAPINSGTYSRKNGGWTEELGGKIFVPFGVYTSINPISVTNSSPYGATVDRIMKFVKFAESALVLTTNDGSNYWTIKLVRWSDDFVIASFTTASMTAGAVALLTTTSFNAASIGASDVGMYINCSKTSSPGNLYLLGPLLEVSI